MRTYLYTHMYSFIMSLIIIQRNKGLLWFIYVVKYEANDESINMPGQSECGMSAFFYNLKHTKKCNYLYCLFIEKSEINQL